ncbi:acyltransferase [Rhodocytophaga aerolata]|uniref:Acyltransferase n=1 Tax=Rhodocytophaga aerolata TaxID=455078 RepID=A0ABT8RG74_9BACT|nr:acyltransferase [Rhodocytophaga aerolata]MDO1449800.1 acyltransferase [Rhodocytophaga aerolata]
MRFNHIDALRGVAGLCVTYFHLSGSSGLAKDIAATGQYGYLGVEVFFVISGFILPYSLYKRNYHISYYSVFLLKRILRLDPPYLFAIAIGLSLSTLAGHALPSWQRLLAHIGYANAILGFEWISPVFWTLAIEFQFYLFLGITYSGFTTKSHLKALIFIILIVFSSFFVKDETFLPHWFGLFALGILAFRYMQLGMSSIKLWSAVIVITVVVALNNGILEAIVGLLSLLYIIFVRISQNTLVSKVLLWLGMISYSLYLTHWEFGRTGVAVFRHVPILGEFEVCRLIFGMCVALLIGWILFKLIENQAIRLSNKISYPSDLNNKKIQPHVNIS